MSDLHSALESGDFDTALRLLQEINSNQSSAPPLPDQNTPLHYVCRHGRVDLIEQLVTDFQYTMEDKDVNGYTPLHIAAQYGQLEVIKHFLNTMVLDEDLLSDVLSDMESDSELSQILSLTFQQKVSESHRDLAGNTLLHTACIHDCLEVVEFLIREIGYDPSDSNGDGLTSLHLAASHGTCHSSSSSQKNLTCWE